MTFIPFVGPVYTMTDGTKLHDIEAGCTSCSKRLAEVVFDPAFRWNTGQIVCIDCGVVHRLPDRLPTVRVVPSRRAPGKFLAGCTCGYYTQITSRESAEHLGAQHLATHVPVDAA